MRDRSQSGWPSVEALSLFRSVGAKLDWCHSVKPRRSRILRVRWSRGIRDIFTRMLEEREEIGEATVMPGIRPTIILVRLPGKVVDASRHMIGHVGERQPR